MKRSENMDEIYIYYVYLKKYYSITIRCPTIIFADYIIVIKANFGQKNNFENLSAACGVKIYRFQVCFKITCYAFVSIE